MFNRFNQVDSYIGMGEVLIKGDAKDPNVIYIQASNQITDAQNDIVLQKALNAEVENFLKKGVISWNHLHKATKDPKYIIGEPLDAKFPEDKTTLIKGKIYPSNNYGKTVLNMVKDGSSRLGASVGGHVVQRIKTFVPTLKKSVSAIVKVLWDETAITHEPINDGTRGQVSFVPFAAFAKSFIMDDVEREGLIQKALTAGYGTDSSQMTGGRALIPESLMGASNKVSQKELTYAFGLVLKEIKQKKVKNYEDLNKMFQGSKLSAWVPTIAKTISDSLPKLKNI